MCFKVRVVSIIHNFLLYFNRQSIEQIPAKIIQCVNTMPLRSKRQSQGHPGVLYSGMPLAYFPKATPHNGCCFKNHVWIYPTFSVFPELFKKPIGVKMGSTQIETHSNFARKVRKTPDFLSKSGVFMAYLPLMDTMHHVLKAWCIILWVRL